MINFQFSRYAIVATIADFNRASEGSGNEGARTEGSGIEGYVSEGSGIEGYVSEGSGSEDVDNNVFLEENGESDGYFDIENDGVNANSEEVSGNGNEEDDENVRSNDVFENPDDNLESTSVLRSPAADYDFSEDRRLVRVEKLLMHACQALESIKHEALKIKSSETKRVVEKMVLVCKDLSVEVFTCTEELKKRNGHVDT